LFKEKFSPKRPLRPPAARGCPRGRGRESHPPKNVPNFFISQTRKPPGVAVGATSYAAQCSFEKVILVALLEGGREGGRGDPPKFFFPKYYFPKNVPRRGQWPQGVKGCSRGEREGGSSLPPKMGREAPHN